MAPSDSVSPVTQVLRWAPGVCGRITISPSHALYRDVFLFHHGGLRWQEGTLLVPQAGLDSDSLFISKSRRPLGMNGIDHSPTASGAGRYEITWATL